MKSIDFGSIRGIGDLRQIHTRAKAFARPGQQDCMHCLVGTRCFNGVYQFTAELGIEGIALLGSIEGDVQHVPRPRLLE